MIEKNPVFVKLEDSSSLRRDILNSAVGTARALKSYEDLLKIREDKEKRIESLKKLVNNINKKFSELSEETIPALEDIEKEISGKTIKKEELKKSLPKTKVVKKDIHGEHVSGLDKEIADIKIKLAKLNV